MQILLKDVIKIKHGYAFKGEHFTNQPTSYIVVTPGNFTTKGGFQDTEKFYDTNDFPKEFILKDNDLIVTMTDLSKMADTIGFSALVPKNSKYKYLHNQRIGLVDVFNSDFDRNYIYWLMRSPHYQKTIANSSNGATVHHTSPDKIYRYKFEKINLTTQIKIANILSTYDDLIENNNKRIKLLEKMAENLYKEWFVRFRFPGYENAEYENGIPKGWKIEKLGNVSNICTGKCNRQDAEDNGEYPLFDRSQEIKKSNSWLLDCEAIIVPGEGTSFISRYYKGKFNLHQRCYCIEPKISGTGKFLYYTLLFNRAYFLNVATGATVPSLRLNNFTKMKFILPSFELCSQFDEFVTNIFKKIEQLELTNQNLIKQRDLLLPRLMSGKLEVE